VSRDKYNDDAFKEYNEKALVPCDGCGRTFLPDSLIKHQKSCKGSSGTNAKKDPWNKRAGGGFGAPPPKAAPVKQKKIIDPIALICFICGGKFGSASLKIHIPQCEKKWQAQEAKKPRNERRPVPTAPSGFDEVKIGGSGGSAKKGITSEMEEYNTAAYNDYNDKALEKCEGCGRTFLPESLIKHQKMCLKGKTRSSPAQSTKDNSPSSSMGGKGSPGRNMNKMSP
jgi:hypothetical protein